MTKALTGRSQRVLGRFPYHMEAASRGKLLANVTQALVRDQDVQAAELQGIRLAHRLFDARELADLLRIGALHHISKSEMAVLFQRFTRLREGINRLHAHISTGGDVGELEALANQLLVLWPSTNANPLKTHYEDTVSTTPFDVVTAATALLSDARQMHTTEALLSALRHRIAEVSAIHHEGNGTVRALLRGAANCLDVDLGKIEHSDDRFWHAAPVTDRIRLHRQLPNSDQTQPIPLPLEFLGIEENPKRIAEFGPKELHHREYFQVLRKGFDDALLEIRIRGVGLGTVSPMIVNRDAGHGVGLYAAIPDGQEVVLTQGGRALLNGKDITSRCYAWQGACFAEDVGASGNANEHLATGGRDFVFADQAQLPADGGDDGMDISRFVRASPAQTLDREALLPHGGDSLSMPNVRVGKTRFAFFVQHGHFAAKNIAVPPLPDGSFGADPFASTPALVRADRELVTPRYGNAIADASVFAEAGDAVIAAANTAAGAIQLRWLERQAYKVRLFVPKRFAGFDDDGGEAIKNDIKLGIERFRPAGVDVEVVFVDDHWSLNDADLPHGDAADDSAISRIRSQTILHAAADLALEP